MQAGNPQYSLLPTDFKVYVGPDGRVVPVPTSGYEERSLPTVNKYTGADGGYIACYSRNQEGSVYSVGSGIYVMGQIRLQGQYVNGIFQPSGYENRDISAVQELKDLSNQTFPACKGGCWAGGDTNGWFGLRPDPFDSRDKVLDIPIPKTLPATVDLRAWCSPVVNQGNINACTANAAVALVEYFQKRSSGRFITASRLFLYKATRNLRRQTGDTGANTRTTMKALATIGVPPEDFWPYDESKVNEEPSAFCYAVADRYRATQYFRLDPRGRPKDIVLQHVKACLAANRPVMFGIMGYTKCWQQFVATDNATGKLPFPTASDTIFGGHNMAVVGYDDGMKVKNTEVDGIETTGAFLVKNSYGDQWGDKGYGWVPYEYLLKQKTIDWWTIIKQEWLDTNEFGS